jgi:flavin reductase (DIM6/NTAB) family NADH-FMN oxidoreductase RutF
MTITKEDLLTQEPRYRAKFINSLAGLKQAFLIGTQSHEGQTNLAIFNSLIHIGANPPLWGFICRPDTVKRDTLNNILNTNYYTFNYISSIDFEKAHQTSAKYETEISEFKACGFTEQYVHTHHAPFALEAKVKIAMKFQQKIDITINNTILVIGSIEHIIINEDIISEDGFVALEEENILGSVGLDAYYKSECIGRLSYAQPNQWPSKV